MAFIRFSFANTHSIDDADAVVQGVPSQAGSLYGSPASGPFHFRLASHRIYGSTYGRIWDAKIADAGDMEASGTAMDIALSIRPEGRFPVIVGGDHSITYGIIKSLKSPLVIVDSHPDVFPSPFSHASFVRWVAEELGSDNILIMGVANASRAEIEMLEKSGIRYFTSADVRRGDAEIPFSRFHLSIDMDAFYLQPGSYQPEALGLFPHEFLGFIEPYAGSMSSIDIVELSAETDISMISGLTAARIAVELIAMKFGRGLPADKV